MNLNTIIRKKIDNKFYSKPELNNIQKGIIGLILDRPNITQDEMANLLGITSRTIRNHIKYLIDNNYIEKTGATKKGEWIVRK